MARLPERRAPSTQHMMRTLRSQDTPAPGEQKALCFRNKQRAPKALLEEVLVQTNHLLQFCICIIKVICVNISPCPPNPEAQASIDGTWRKHPNYLLFNRDIPDCFQQPTLRFGGWDLPTCFCKRQIASSTHPWQSDPNETSKLFQHSEKGSKNHRSFLAVESLKKMAKFIATSSTFWFHEEATAIANACDQSLMCFSEYLGQYVGPSCPSIAAWRTVMKPESLSCSMASSSCSQNESYSSGCLEVVT